MQNATQETATQTKTLAITDENISQADYERMRAGETVEVEESAPEVKTSSKKVDDSETSKLEAQDDSDDESESSDETSDLEKPKKKLSGYERRIKKLVNEREAERREKEFLREQIAKLQKPPEDVKPKVVIEGKPSSDNFESYDDYVEALTEWKADQKLKAKDEEVKKETLKTKAQERVKTHNERVDVLRKDHPDFDEHAANFFADHGSDFKLSGEFEDILTESENSAEILYELFKTPEEFLRINSLSGFNAAREIGRLEARLSSASKESKPTEVKTKTTKAPPPARPISATSANGKKSPEDMTQSEYERYRDEMEKRRRAY